MIRNPLEQFEIVRLIPIRIGKVDISFTNASLWMIMIVGMIGVMIVKSGRVIPGRWQSIWEGMYRVVVGMVYESIGKEIGGEMVGKVMGLFVFILGCNLAGLVPYSYTVTAQIVVTMMLALGVWIGKLWVGVSRHGKELLGLFKPAGAPFAMIPFFVLLEVIGFIVPVISLSVRLFANMMSGHILLKVLFGFTWSMMLAGGWLYIGHIVSLGVLFLLLGLETAVAIIQAYVFSLLTCVYIGEVVKGGH